MAAVSGDRAIRHQRIDHKFNFELFDYDTPENFQPCIKLEFFFYKLPDVSSEHFHKHYAHIHSDITVAARSFGAHKVQRYTQLHQTPEMKTRAKALGMDVFDYDGCSALWFQKWEDAEAFFASPEYSSLSADCAHFMDTSRGIKVMAGRELIAFGKAIPDVDSTDGITEYVK
ncbi:unnamed protein product [Clonostachys rosea]|uniref:EthD domain-containing protein n=1 Tax=Bionectria ochroleuca TaxID=29856 RepID=A0ABY6USP4_BIOOC|nr:unnamed protein product [Clonostachys rosea]